MSLVAGGVGNVNHAGTLHHAETGRAWGDDFNGGDACQASGTSIFDPVLCELVYRWFCVPGGFVLDPFAGGSVRGIVAATLGLNYVGIDLSARQIAANEKQATVTCRDGITPTWIVGDSRNVGVLAAGEYDLVFSCPPYADLEVYSEDPADISTLPYVDFREAYRHIIRESVSMLKPNRFAVFVVCEVRGSDGFYYGLVPDTVRAFEEAGARFYNEAILVTAVGSLPVRAPKQFVAARKLGKTHQNVLAFYKGDPKAIRSEFPAQIEFGEATQGEDGDPVR